MIKVGSEEYLKALMSDEKISQTEALKRIKAFAEVALKRITDDQDGTLVLSGENSDDFAKFVFNTSIEITPHVVSPSLAAVLKRTKTSLKLHLLLKRYGERSKISEDNFSIMVIQIGAIYGVTLVSPLGLGIFIFQKGYSCSYIPKEDVTPDANLDDLIEDIESCSEEKAAIYKALSYIVCSGQPDLREEKAHSRLESPKRFRKAKTFNKPIMPRTMVGLGFEKLPNYKVGQWGRIGFWRNQPYGPKGNPTHYELIWINHTTITRKLS